MKTYLYLCLTPEALVASHLPPVEFGKYLAIGSRRQVSGPAIFFELDITHGGDFTARAEHACKPHHDGSPRRSTYLAVYRVVERIPQAALGALHLVTRNGFVLNLKRAELPPETSPETYFLYQELSPVSPRVVSRLNPQSFAAALTDPASAIHVPTIIFADLRLGPLANQHDSKQTGQLPYANLEHLRSCLENMAARPDKTTKIVNRDAVLTDLYYMIRTGVYVGSSDGLLFYPMPDEDTLSRDHGTWWHDARANPRY
jgi:hypothetical protein